MIAPAPGSPTATTRASAAGCFGVPLLHAAPRANGKSATSPIWLDALMSCLLLTPSSLGRAAPHRPAPDDWQYCCAVM